LLGRLAQMSSRPRTFVPLVVVALLLIGLAGCSDSPASVGNSQDDPRTKGTDGNDGTEGTEGTEPTDEPLCAATASIEGATYHVVQVQSQDYGVNPTHQLEGTASDCSGSSTQAMTFHAIPQVNPAWAICGLVDGHWRVFLADDLSVPADSTLARLVVGQ